MGIKQDAAKIITWNLESESLEKSIKVYSG